MRRGLSAHAQAIWGDPEAAEEAEAAAAAQVAKARSREVRRFSHSSGSSEGTVHEGTIYEGTPSSSSTETPHEHGEDDEAAIAHGLVRRAVARALGEAPPPPPPGRRTPSSAPGSFVKKRRGRPPSPDVLGGEPLGHRVDFVVGVHDQLVSSSKPSLNPKFSPVPSFGEDPVCVAICRCLGFR